MTPYVPEAGRWLWSKKTGDAGNITSPPLTREMQKCFLSFFLCRIFLWSVLCSPPALTLPPPLCLDFAPSYPMEHGAVKDWEGMERVWSHVYSNLNVMAEEHNVWHCLCLVDAGSCVNANEWQSLHVERLLILLAPSHTYIANQFMCLEMNMHMNVYLHVHNHIDICTFTHTHTHTHVHKLFLIFHLYIFYIYAYMHIGEYFYLMLLKMLFHPSFLHPAGASHRGPLHHTTYEGADGGDLL